MFYTLAIYSTNRREQNMEAPSYKGWDHATYRGCFVLLGVVAILFWTLALVTAEPHPRHEEIGGLSEYMRNIDIFAIVATVVLGGLIVRFSFRKKNQPASSEG